MRIVFINYYNYLASSGVHIHFIANEMTRMGHECTVVVPEVTNTDTFGTPEYFFSTYAQFGDDVVAGRYDSDTILHGWTPRENTRLPTVLAAQFLGAPYFVHLEDNERRILEEHHGRPFNEMLREALAGKTDFSDASLHPILHQAFLAEAAGVSILMDKLGEFVPPDVPTQLVWPACEREFFQLPQQPDMRLRATLGIPQDAAVIVYPGNAHSVNYATVNQLYLALPLVRKMGHNIRLVRCAGSDSVIMDEVQEIAGEYIMNYPGLPSRKLMEWVGMADLLVQPGAPDSFDDYRFPSKLPLFMASGRPVVLPRAHLGRFLDDGENCLILEENTPDAIARKIVWLLEHPAEAAAIGRKGRIFAAKNFSWQKTAKTLLDFYAANAHRKCPKK